MLRTTPLLASRSNLNLPMQRHRAGRVGLIEGALTQGEPPPPVDVLMLQVPQFSESTF